MGENNSSEVVRIRKYPNRRYYDATRSCHVTLQDVHKLVVSGREVCITDSRNGDDITNLVLTQILLEKDEPKLDLFPSSILHHMIRSNRQALRTTFERFFGPVMGMMASSQKQFDALMRQSMGGAGFVNPANPMDWAKTMKEAFGGVSPPASDSPPPVEEADAEAVDDATLDELRSQLSGLRERIDELSAAKGGRDSGS